MNATLRTALIGIGGFAVSFVAGNLITGMVGGDEGTAPRLPTVTGEVVRVAVVGPANLPGIELDTDVLEPIDGAEGIATPQAGFAPIETPSSSGGGAVGAAPPPGTGAGSDEPGTAEPGTDAPGDDPATGPVLDDAAGGLPPTVLLPDLVLSPDFFFDTGLPPGFRFFDLCADAPSGPSCPLGLGGTVLGTTDAGDGFSSLGDFRLGTRVSLASSDAVCGGYVDSQPRDTQHPLFLWSSHPANFEIRMYTNPATASHTYDLIRSGTAVDGHPEYLRFIDAANEGILATSPWPRDCVVLVEKPDASRYYIDVVATSFLGETATASYVFDLPEGRRPPVGWHPMSDHDVRFYVPITEAQAGAVAVIQDDEPTTCADLEAARRADFGRVLPRTSGATIFDWGRQPREGAYSERFDPAYDADQVLNVLGLRSGMSYRVCVWWLEASGSSFEGASIVEREVLRLATPRAMTPLIEFNAVENTTGRTILAREYEVSLECPGPRESVRVPYRDLDPPWAHTDPRVMCDFDGRAAPSVVRGSATSTERTVEFTIPLERPSEPRFDFVRVDLSVGADPGFGTGILTDGSRDGPNLIFGINYVDRGTGGVPGRWTYGGAFAFEPPADGMGDGDGPDDTIRIDSMRSGVEAAGPNALAVTTTFDRPVSIQAYLLPNALFAGLTGDDPRCLTGPDPRVNIGALSDTHSFTMDGLCPLTNYTVAVVATDESGNRGVFTDMTVPAAIFVEGTNLHSDWGASGRTGGYPVEYVVGNTGLPTTGGLQIRTLEFQVTILRDTWDMRRNNWCLHDNFFGSPTYEPLGGLAPGATRSAEWGDEVTVVIRFAGEEAMYWPDAPPHLCVSRGGYIAGFPSWRGTVTATFSIEDFQRGITIPVRVGAVSLSDTTGPIDFSIRINGRRTD